MTLWVPNLSSSPCSWITSLSFTRPPIPISIEDPSRCVSHRRYLLSTFTENLALAFRNKIYHHISSAEPGDFKTFTQSLVQSSLNFSTPRHTDALCEILITGDILRIDGLYGYETPLFIPFAIRFVKKVDVFGEGLYDHLAIFEALVKRYFEASDIRQPS